VDEVGLDRAKQAIKPPDETELGNRIFAPFVVRNFVKRVPLLLHERFLAWLEGRDVHVVSLLACCVSPYLSVRPKVGGVAFYNQYARGFCPTFHGVSLFDDACCPSHPTLLQSHSSNFEHGSIRIVVRHPVGEDL
jgi:hypothetical protein